MKVLQFTARGEDFQVDIKGRIKRLDIKGFEFSNTWRLRGFMSHHWCNSPNITLIDAMTNPKQLIGCLVCDIDHGTFRVWGGQYYGRLPRVTSSFMVESTK